MNSNSALDRLKETNPIDYPPDLMGEFVDRLISLNSRNPRFRAMILLFGVLNSAFAQQDPSGLPVKKSPAWKVLFPIGADSGQLPALSPVRPVQDFRLYGPHADHPFLLGDFETNGLWTVTDSQLHRNGGENALLALPEAEQFDVEGVISSDRLGGMLFLVGWTPENSGYVLYNVTLKSKKSGSPWHLCPVENGRCVEGQDREVARHEWEGLQSIRLSVHQERLSLSLGKTRVIQDLALPAYARGKIMLGTYSTRYGPKNLRIRSLRIREIPPLPDESSPATESSR